MKDEDKSYLWMIQHHIEALVTLLDMNKQHEILNNNVAYDFMHYMSSQSETVWEEGVWEMVAEILLEEPKEKGENVIQFSPELRGPDR
jgi:hypothetical protein|tara:strand:+ start:81 stop:344 length:264 start_codon:yes stop_codon:yes gene_type:complete